VSDDYSLYYSVWCTNDQEFYNLKVRTLITTKTHLDILIEIKQDDPLQTTNLAFNISAHQSYTIANRHLGQIIPRLDALMMVLKSCNGDACREPWRQLHPKGYVNSLADALDAGFDEFYANQPKVSFSECNLGYHIYAEGPQAFNVYGSISNEERD
jgi:hypothetical protein